MTGPVQASESRHVSAELTDIVGDWIRKNNHVAFVPHAVVTETRSGSIDLEMRTHEGHTASVHIDSTKAAEIRGALNPVTRTTAILEAAKSALEQLRSKTA